MNKSKLLLIFLTSGLTAFIPGVQAEEEIPFDEAELFFELNDTDGDLGIHGKIDGGLCCCVYYCCVFV